MMKTETKSSSTPVASQTTRREKGPLLWAALLLAVVLILVFWRCFIPSYVLFSNDGPYGATSGEYILMRSTIRGVWANLNWFGNEALSPSPSVSSLMRLLSTPFMDAKITCPMSLFILGIGAAFCFRKLRFAPAACILGGLAAALNSGFFSTSCWGVSTQSIGIGFMFIAIGLISDNAIKRQWVRIVLAGMAVGVGVMEAYDIGAMFSLFVATYVLYHALFLSPKAPISQKAVRGALQLALVAGFAAFIAAHSLFNLVGTQIKGISGMDQDPAVKAARYQEATFYSIPVPQTLQIIVPGIFGFRDHWYMYEFEEPREDQFWSMNGAHPIGTGLYAGVPVVLIALWGAVQAFRKRGSPFTDAQRRAIWFWIGTFLIGVLFAYGKHAPFYQLFYAIPYSSTIRNPQKFMHIAQWSLIILFGYGTQGIITGYMRDRLTSFNRRWLVGGVIAFIGSLVFWAIYAACRPQLVDYVQTLGIKPDEAPGVVGFSIHAVGWFVLFLALTLGLLILIFSGQFSGSRAKWGCALLGALLVVDLGRADSHWILYWDTDYYYAKDPVIEFLADKPYEHRVAWLPVLPAGVDAETTNQLNLLNNSYQTDWKQHLFPYYNIQCAEVVQEPRLSEEKKMFMSAFAGDTALRQWQLLNCRYLLGSAEFVRQHGAQFGMSILKTFDFVQKGPHPNKTTGIFGLTATNQNNHISPVEVRTEFKPDGKLAIIEFRGALPRAKLYSHWETNVDESSTLRALADPRFDPTRDVFVETTNNLPAPGDPNADAGTVEIHPDYKSKHIAMTADAKTPAVMLLSERYSPKWEVEVDGKPASLLRCNFIERGVFLTPGKHEIVMRFAPPIGTLWISLAAIVIGLGLWGCLIFAPKENGD